VRARVAVEQMARHPLTVAFVVLLGAASLQQLSCAATRSMLLLPSLPGAPALEPPPKPIAAVPSPARNATTTVKSNSTAPPPSARVANATTSTIKPTSTNKFDAIVIGAGIAGLTAARDLQAAGWQVVVLEAASRIGELRHRTACS
jgi:hypothetical protein